MRIYSWGMRFCVARDEAEARAKFETPATVKVTLTDRTEALAALCRDYLGEDAFYRPDPLREYTFRIEGGQIVYGTEDAIDALRNRLKALIDAADESEGLHGDLETERAEHGRTRDQLHSYADQLEAKVSQLEPLRADLAETQAALSKTQAYSRLLTIQLEKAPKESELNELKTALLKSERELAIAYTDLKTYQAKSESLRAEVNGYKSAVTVDLPSLRYEKADEAHAEATKAFLAGDDISETPPVVVLSALAKKHGEAVSDMANEGFNPDEIAASINLGLSRNNQIAAPQVKKILIEMKKAGRS